MTQNLKEGGIHVMNAALDEVVSSKEGNQIALRGVIDPASLQHLRVDDYQREPLPLSQLSKMWQALRDGESLPDIELGMRSQTFESVVGSSDFWLPKDKVYIIDGQQRRNAALHILSLMPDLKVRLGAMIHFGTTREWERERFRILNLDRSKVSANVLLRNMRHQSAAVLTLYGLSHSTPDFALFERVCWKQSMSSNEMLTARTLVSVVGVLHAHRSPAFRMSLSELVPALDRQAQFVKLDQWRKNIVTFFDVIDAAFGLRKVSMRDLALQARAGFLIQLALVLSDHRNFWRGDKETELHLDADLMKRLSLFPLHDPAVMQVISSSSVGYGGGQQGLLYSLLRDHFNKGRTTGRLRNRADEEASNAPRSFSNYRAESSPSKENDDDISGLQQR